MNRLGLLISILTMAFALTFTTTAQEDGVVLGISLPGSDGAFFGSILASANNAVADSDVTLSIIDAEWDVETELSNVQSLLDAGVSALLLLPVDAKGSVDAVIAANQAGVPVYVMLTELVPDEGVELDIAGMIAPDAEATGVKAAEYVCELLESEGNVLELTDFEAVDMSEMDENDDMMADVSANQMISAAFNSYVADSCTDVSVNTTNLTDVEMDDLFDAVDAALAENDYGVVTGFGPEAVFEAVNVKFATLNRSLIIVSFAISSDVLASIELGDIEAIISADPALLGGYAVNTVLAAMSDDVQMDEDMVLEAFVLSGDLFTAVRCRPDCDD